MPWSEMNITPREWQAEALPIAINSMKSGNRSLIQAIMGAGKTILMCGVVKSLFHSCPGKIVISCPKRELVRQTMKTLKEFFSCGGWFTDEKQDQHKIIVTCNKSLIPLSRHLSEQNQKISLWICDEAHSSEAAQVKQFVEHAKPALSLGLTATPQRAKRNECLSLWDKEIYRYDIKNAIRDGVVVPFKVEHWTGGDGVDIDTASLEMIKCLLERQDGHFPGIVNAHHTKAGAEEFSDRLNAEGVRSDFVHSSLSSRQLKEKIAALQHGELDVLCQVHVLTEGVDFPWLRFMCMKRKISSRVAFAQSAGRAIRSYPGKSEAVILDPHDLFSKFEIDQAAILELLDGTMTESEVEEKDIRERTTPEPEIQFAVSLTPIESTLKKWELVLRSMGLIRPLGFGMASEGYREIPASTYQLDSIKRLSVDPRLKKNILELPRGCSDSVRQSYRFREELSSKGASDLASCMSAIINMKTQLSLF